MLAPAQRTVLCTSAVLLVSACVAVVAGEAAVRVQEPEPGRVERGSHKERAQEALGHAKWEDAEREFRQAILASPEDAEALRGLGLVLLQMNRLSEAAPVLTRAASVGPNLHDVFYLLGLAQFGSGNAAAAAGSLQNHLKRHPDDRQALLFLARAHAALGRPADAVRALERILESAPNDADALLLAAQLDSTRAPAFGKRLLEAAPNSFQAHIWRATQAERENQAETAVREYRLAIEKAPPSMAGLHFGLARSYMKMADYERTCEELRQELRVNPYSGPSYLLLGAMLVIRGEFEQAVLALQGALKLGYKPADANSQLGRAYVRLRKFEEARGALEEAVRLQPSLKEAHYELSRVYARLGRHEEAAEQVRLFEELKAKEQAEAPPPKTP